jgi:glyoxylase-like metal-dependent hydrolase (beta-lactamase superfamily II)
MSNDQVLRLTVGKLASNCYLFTDDKHEATAIIDPGDDAEYIKNVISDKNLKPKCIIATHGHFDHIMAALDLKLTYKIPFCISKKDEFLVKKMKDTAKYFLSFDSGPPPEIDKYLDNQDNIKVGSISLEIISTPGHTPGSVTFYSKKMKVAFVGDLLFKGGGVGRYDFKYASKDDLEKSVKKVLTLDDDTIIYPGHSDETYVGNEKGFHHFLD